MFVLLLILAFLWVLAARFTAHWMWTRWKAPVGIRTDNPYVFGPAIGNAWNDDKNRVWTKDKMVFHSLWFWWGLWVWYILYGPRPDGKKGLLTRFWDWMSPK